MKRIKTLMHSMKKYIPLALIVILVSCAWWYDLLGYFTIETFKLYQHKIKDFVAQHYGVSLLCFFVVDTVLMSLSIPTVLLTILGGFLYGPFVITPLVVLSATVGSCVLFLSAKSAVPDFKSQVWFQNMKEGFRKNAFSYLLSIRLVPVIPFFAVTLGCAFLKVPFRAFVLATFLGVIPGAFVYAFIGYSLEESFETLAVHQGLILSLVALGVLSALPILSKYLPRLIRAFKRCDPA